MNNHSASNWTAEAMADMRAKALAELTQAMDKAIAEKNWDLCIHLNKTIQGRLFFLQGHASVTNERCSPSEADWEAWQDERRREA